MRYRITIESLAAEGVKDPTGNFNYTYDDWKMNFFQHFDDDKLNDVVAAVADAVNKARQPKLTQEDIDRWYQTVWKDLKEKQEQTQELNERMKNL